MSSSYEEIATRLFGTSEQNPPQPAMPDLDGAVDTSGGIAAALSISPSELQQDVRVMPPMNQAAFKGVSFRFLPAC